MVLDIHFLSNLFQALKTTQVTSWLTQEDEEQVEQLLGRVRLHLLYKASVHGFGAKSFHDKCDRQGPTLTVAYNRSGYVFGGYTSVDFESYRPHYDDQAFLFRLCKEAKGKPLKFPVKPGAVAVSSDSRNGPNFGGLAFLREGICKTIVNESDHSFSFTSIELYGDDANLAEFEVYRVEELKSPWRNLTWSTQKRRELMDCITTFNLYGNTVPKARILLIGPVGGGKSNFINSAKSVFRGYVTSQALAGGRTAKYSAYPFREGEGCPSPPLILCDTMGLAEGTDPGIHSDDILNIIEGHVPNKYQFNATSPIDAGSKSYIKSVPVSEKIHCVVYVIDANKTPILSSKMEKKVCAIRSRIDQFDVPQIVLLTKVDKECPLVRKGVENVYYSDIIEKQVLEVEKQLNIPVTCIIPVENYWSTHELDCATDILILSALLQMLRYADSFLENLAHSSSSLQLNSTAKPGI
ncbi:interferon-induced protein 44-like [Scyliorhinus canicula]|uniref:interferon-induced protein 44-like n=1 Tax=Scyliorhinus canicula TaxID=7830 RepID=UPI0018F37E8F|nr:interferon-induced protein 44-like [Scyliorhinus canicula]